MPARSVRLQDGLAHGGERRGDRIASKILEPVLREGCGRRMQDSSSSDWELDDKSTQHLLNSKTLEWTPVRPTMRITRSTGWVRPGSRHPLEARRALQPHPGTGGTARVDPGRLGVDDLRTHAPGQGHFRAEAGRGAVDARRGAERQGHSVQPDGFHPGVVRGDHRCLHVLRTKSPLGKSVLRAVGQVSTKGSLGKSVLRAVGRIRTKGRWANPY